jgi:hypothetical protein
MFEIGKDYTREKIRIVCGGNKQAFLPTRSQQQLHGWANFACNQNAMLLASLGLGFPSRGPCRCQLPSQRFCDATTDECAWRRETASDGCARIRRQNMEFGDDVFVFE